MNGINSLQAALTALTVANQRKMSIYKFDYLVPVPLAPKRENLRGFNQAEKLGNYLKNVILEGTKRSNIKLDNINLLVRNRETKPQFDLKYEDRQSNVAAVRFHTVGA